MIGAPAAHNDDYGIEAPVHKPLSPSQIHPPFAAYSHGIEVAAGSRLVFCSGQLGIDAQAFIPPDCAGQAALCFEAIQAILRTARMDLADIVRINTFVTGREHLQPYMQVRDRLFSEPFPASTLIIVAGFARPEFVVEIEVIAAAPPVEGARAPRSEDIGR